MDRKASVRDYLKRANRSRELEDDQDIFATGFANSLFALQLVMFVEKEFGITVEDDDLQLENFNSVTAITRFVDSKS